MCSRCKLPQHGLYSGAQAEIEFGGFSPENMIYGGINFTNVTDHIVCVFSGIRGEFNRHI